MTWKQFKTGEIEQTFASVSPKHAAAIEHVCETMFNAGLETEREACAKLADDEYAKESVIKTAAMARMIAGIIRART